MKMMTNDAITALDEQIEAFTELKEELVKLIDQIDVALGEMEERKHFIEHLEELPHKLEEIIKRFNDDDVNDLIGDGFEI